MSLLLTAIFPSTSPKQYLSRHKQQSEETMIPPTSNTPPSPPPHSPQSPRNSTLRQSDLVPTPSAASPQIQRLGGNALLRAFHSRDYTSTCPPISPLIGRPNLPLLPLEQLSSPENDLPTPYIRSLVERVENGNKSYNPPKDIDDRRGHVTEDEGEAAIPVLPPKENVESEVAVVQDASRNGHSPTPATTAAEIEGEILPLEEEIRGPSNTAETREEEEQIMRGNPVFSAMTNVQPEATRMSTSSPPSPSWAQSTILAGRVLRPYIRVFGKGSLTDNRVQDADRSNNFVQDQREDREQTDIVKNDMRKDTSALPAPQVERELAVPSSADVEGDGFDEVSNDAQNTSTSEDRGNDEGTVGNESRNEGQTSGRRGVKRARCEVQSTYWLRSKSDRSRRTEYWLRSKDRS